METQQCRILRERTPGEEEEEEVEVAVVAAAYQQRAEDVVAHQCMGQIPWRCSSSILSSSSSRIQGAPITWNSFHINLNLLL
jgi:hypothetical protein